MGTVICCPTHLYPSKIFCRLLALLLSWVQVMFRGFLLFRRYSRRKIDLFWLLSNSASSSCTTSKPKPNGILKKVLFPFRFLFRFPTKRQAPETGAQTKAPISAVILPAPACTAGSSDRLLFARAIPVAIYFHQQYRLGEMETFDHMPPQISWGCTKEANQVAFRQRLLPMQWICRLSAELPSWI